MHVRAGDEVLVARLPAEERPREGRRVRVGVRREHVHVFDAETGERLEWT